MLIERRNPSSVDQILPEYIVAYLRFGAGRKAGKPASISDKLCVLCGGAYDFAKMPVFLYAENLCVERNGRQVRMEKVEVYNIAYAELLMARKKYPSCTDIPYGCGDIRLRFPLSLCRESDRNIDRYFDIVAALHYRELFDGSAPGKEKICIGSAHRFLEFGELAGICNQPL